MGLATVMIEEHARAAVHLADDHTLGAVDDEGALVRHEGHVAHVDVLLLDIQDRLGACILVNLEHDQTQRDLQRRGIGQPALDTLVDVIFRFLELVGYEFQAGRLGKIRDREHGPEDTLQSGIVALIGGNVRHQELLVGRALDLDKVGHRDNLADATETVANALARSE